jgi:hypothetical protein
LDLQIIELTVQLKTKFAGSSSPWTTTKESVDSTVSNDFRQLEEFVGNFQQLHLFPDFVQVDKESILFHFVIFICKQLRHICQFFAEISKNFGVLVTQGERNRMECPKNLNNLPDLFFTLLLLKLEKS